MKLRTVPSWFKVLAAAACLAAWVAASAAASAQGSPASEGKPGNGGKEAMATGETVKFDVVKKGSNAFGADKPSERLIQSQKDWEDVWKQVAGNVVPRPPAPVFDFSKETLVAVFMGEKKTGGFSLTVESVTKTAETLLVRVAEKAPGSGGLVTQAFTSPFEVVKLPHGNYVLKVERSTK